MSECTVIKGSEGTCRYKLCRFGVKNILNRKRKCESNNQSVSACTGRSARSHHDSFSTNRTLMHDVNSVNNRHSNLKHVSCHGELNITLRLKHFNSGAGGFTGIDQSVDQRTFGICASELNIVFFLFFFKHTR